MQSKHFITARKRSCGKVMFLHLSVILFTGEGSLSRWGVSVQGSLCPGGLCLGGSLSGKSLSREGGLCPWGLCLGVSVQGGLCLEGGLCQGDPPHMVTSGQYASYWNAFLFKIELRLSVHLLIQLPIED